MKNKKLASLSLFISMLCASTSLFAFDEAAKKLFDNGQYEDCIQRVKSRPELRKQRDNIMLLAYSNFQLYNFTKQREYNDEFRTQFDGLRDKMDASDLKGLLFLVNSSDKPAVVESTHDLLKEAFDKLHRIDDVMKILPFTSTPDKESREYAFKAMARLMEPMRDIVKRGGTMRPVDLYYFQHKEVIQAAVDNITLSEARDLLILIEEPALAYLDTSKGSKQKSTAEDIQDDIKDRKKDFPNSSWYSATGKELKASR